MNWFIVNLLEAVDEAELDKSGHNTTAGETVSLASSFAKLHTVYTGIAFLGLGVPLLILSRLFSECKDSCFDNACFVATCCLIQIETVSPTRSQWFELCAYVTSLLEDVAAVYLLNEDTHSASALFLAFLGFPFLDYVLKETTAALTPWCDYDDLLLSFGLEAMQAALFCYFADFSSIAVALFSFIALQQWLSSTIVFATKDQPTGTKPFFGLTKFAEQLLDHGLFFTLTTLSLATIQCVWLLLDLDLPPRTDVDMAILAWGLGYFPLMRGWSQRGSAAGGAISGIFSAVGLPVALIFTELSVVDHWPAVVAFTGGSDFFAFLLYESYLLIVCTLVCMTFAAAQIQGVGLSLLRCCPVPPGDDRPEPAVAVAGTIGLGLYHASILAGFLGLYHVLFAGCGGWMGFWISTTMPSMLVHWSARPTKFYKDRANAPEELWQGHFGVDLDAFGRTGIVQPRGATQVNEAFAEGAAQGEVYAAAVDRGEMTFGEMFRLAFWGPRTYNPDRHLAELGFTTEVSQASQARQSRQPETLTMHREEDDPLSA